MKNTLLIAILILLFSISSNAQKIWSGTGFALNNGYLVTNWHVAEGAQTIHIYGVRGDFTKKYIADVVAKDETNDLAILKISGNGFPGFGTIPYKVRTTTAEVAEDVWVLGFPMTPIMGDEIKYTDGRINSLTGYLGDASTYQISASVSHGSSGGPVFDNYGNIIGIISSGLNADVAQNVFYAIKTSFLKNLVETMRVSNVMPESSQMGNYTKRQDKYKVARNFVFYIECYDRKLPLDEVANRPSYINASPTSIYFSEKQESKALIVSTNAQSWKVTSKPDWCSLTNKTATTITINVTENESYVSRRGAIMLETNDGETVSVSILQSEKKPPYINSTPISLSFSEKQESKTLTISTNAQSWTVSSKPDWCTLTNKTATTITINVTENKSHESRRGAITLEANNGETVSVSVLQSETPLYIIVNPTYIIFDLNGGQKELSIITNSDSWKISSKPDWCTIVSKTETMVKISISNIGYGRRGTIVFDISETNYHKTISIPIEQSNNGQLNGHEWVNIGLPSGTLWATCNVGANRPTDLGNYYAWGELSGKGKYDWSTYRYINANATSLTKYSTDGKFGKNDNLTTLEARDDVANSIWGAGWRMPTKDEFEELINNCTVIWTIQNGVTGRLFTGPNGNSIFLPTSGYYHNYHYEKGGRLAIFGGLFRRGYDGCYWTSTLFIDNPRYAWSLRLNTKNEKHKSRKCSIVPIFDRSHGLSVRPVCNPR